VQRQLQLPLGELDTAARGAGRQRDGAPASGSGRALRDRDHRSPGSQRDPLASRPRHGGLEDWRIDQHTRAAGRRGLAAARAALAGLGLGEVGSGPKTQAA